MPNIYVVNMYKHNPETVIEKENIMILCDFPIHTDPTIKSKKNGYCRERPTQQCLFDMRIPCAHSISTKVFDKPRKYKDWPIAQDGCWLHYQCLSAHLE